MNLLKVITSIIFDLSASFAFLIVLWVAVIKRKEIFRNHLTNRQIDSLLDLRDKLNRIAYDSYNAKYWADNIVAMNTSLIEFERAQPEDFQQHKKMQYDLIWLNRMIDLENFQLFPNDFDQQKLKIYGEYVKQNIEPYSMLKFSELTKETVEEFQNKTLELIKYIEGSVNKLGK